MAANFKMAENFIFWLNEFWIFCVLFFVLGLYFDRTYFKEVKFCPIQDGVWFPRWRPKIKGLLLGDLATFLQSVFCNKFVFWPATWPELILGQIIQKWWIDSRWRFKIKFFNIILEVVIFFQSVFCIRFVQVKRKFSKKNQDGANLNFLKTFVSAKFVSYLHQSTARNRLKKYWQLPELC
jgi:hypothetical protein